MKKRSFAAMVLLAAVGALLFITPVFAEDSCQHEWMDWEITTEPNCTENGEAERYCELCDSVEYKILPATGDHKWGDWKITKKATVFSKGKKVRECLYCNKKQTKAITKIKPFAKFTKKTYSVTAKKTLDLKNKLKIGNGDTITKWKIEGSAAKISKKGKLTAKKKGKVKITAILKTGKKATCTINIKSAKKKKQSAKKKSSASGGGTVYWTPSGSVYHISRSCRTLKRSKTIYSGSISESGLDRCCKVCGH